VLNERKEGVGAVEVTITLYDEQGKPLASGRTGYVKPNVIEPGQRGVGRLTSRAGLRIAGRRPR
jgi:hypothetical protein